MSGNGVGVDSGWPAGQSASCDQWWASAQRFRDLAKTTRAVRTGRGAPRYGYGEATTLNRVARLCARMAARPIEDETGSFW